MLEMMFWLQWGAKPFLSDGVQNTFILFLNNCMSYQQIERSVTRRKPVWQVSFIFTVNLHRPCKQFNVIIMLAPPSCLGGYSWVTRPLPQAGPRREKPYRTLKSATSILWMTWLRLNHLNIAMIMRIYSGISGLWSGGGGGGSATGVT